MTVLLAALRSTVVRRLRRSCVRASHFAPKPQFGAKSNEIEEIFA